MLLNLPRQHVHSISRGNTAVGLPLHLMKSLSTRASSNVQREIDEVQEEFWLTPTVHVVAGERKRRAAEMTYGDLKGMGVNMALFIC